MHLIPALSYDGFLTAIRGAAERLRRPRSGPGNGWGAAVPGVIAELEKLNHSTERDFLAVGERLIQFRSAAREIASEIAALNDLISGERGLQTSAALSGMLENFQGMSARIEQNGQALADVRDLSRGVRQSFSGLHRTVGVFRALCTLTRIETSRLGGGDAGFSHLTEEVAPLAESIRSTAESVLEASSQLDRSVQEAVARASGASARQLRELPALIASVGESLGSLEDRQRRARETAAREAARDGEVCAAIDNLVGALQFHDITRQRIEHVAEALGALRPGFDHGSRSGAPPQARAVLSLQSSQLAGAEEAFRRAIGRIEQDLEAIASRVGEMAEDSRALMGITEDDQDSFFQQMEAAFNAILDGIGSCAGAGREIESTAAGLAGTIGRMRQSVADIRGMEIQIQRIAINATIRAAHLGTGGAALDVIAGAIERLAAESRGATEAVARALDSISDSANRVAGSAGSEDADPAGRMRAALLDLHSSGEASFSRVLQIVDLSARLAEDIGTLRSGISAGRLLTEVVNRVRGELERIGAEALPESADQPGAGAAGGLDDLAQRYTMQTEREVHERVAAGSVVGEPESGPSEPAAAGDDLGDNVELF